MQNDFLETVDKLVYLIKQREQLNKDVKYVESRLESFESISKVAKDIAFEENKPKAVDIEEILSNVPDTRTVVFKCGKELYYHSHGKADNELVFLLSPIGESIDVHQLENITSTVPEDTFVKFLTVKSHLKLVYSAHNGVVTLYFEESE